MSRRRTAAAMVAATLAVTGVAGCSDDASTSTGTDMPESAPTSVDRAAIAESVVAEVIRPAYDLLSTTSTELADTVATACASTAVDVTPAQQSWRAARSAWQATRSIRFGPVMELRAASSIDFPVDPDKVAVLLAGTDPLDPASVADLGADQRGLSGIELVLFADTAPDARDCEYLASATSLVAARAVDIAAAWSTDTSATADTKMFIDDTVNGIVFALTDVSAQRLGPAAGATTETAEFAEVDGGPARSALDDAISATEGAAAVLAVLDPLLRGQSADSADRARDQTAAAIEAIEAITTPLADTVDTAPITVAYDATRTALVTVRSEVASLLGVTLTLGDADGDS